MRPSRQHALVKLGVTAFLEWHLNADASACAYLAEVYRVENDDLRLE